MRDGPLDADQQRLNAFDEHRGLLFFIAYRMLGSVADAEDILQETFIRWLQSTDSDVRSPKAFLITIVTRLCINYLQSARMRREEYVGQWLPERLNPIAVGLLVPLAIINVIILWRRPVAPA